MARYSAGSGGTVVAAVATGVPYAAIRAVTNPITVYEIGVYNNTAVVSNVGIIRDLTLGTATTSITPIADNAGTPTWKLDTFWTTTKPTITANTYLRQIAIPAVIGNGYTFVFPSGIVVAAGASLILWNYGGSTSAATYIHAVADE